MKTMSPELFSNRDPLGGDVQQGLDISEFALLPGKTHDGYRVVFYRLSDTTTNKFVHLSITKAFFMVNDMWLSEVGLADGYVAIFDMKGFSLGHLARISLSVMSKYMFYIQDCHPARLKSIHVINSSSFVDKVLALIKPFMRSGMMDMLHFHGPVESISDVVPLDILPQEYNGKAPSMGELHADMRRLLEGRYIDWFSLEEKLRVDETKRTGKSPVADTIFGVEGSFRKLDID